MVTSDKLSTSGHSGGSAKSGAEKKGYSPVKDCMHEKRDCERWLDDGKGLVVEQEGTKVDEGVEADISPDVSLVQQESDEDCEEWLDDRKGLVVEDDEKEEKPDTEVEIELNSGGDSGGGSERTRGLDEEEEEEEQATADISTIESLAQHDTHDEEEEGKHDEADVSPVESLVESESETDGKECGQKVSAKKGGVNWCSAFEREKEAWQAALRMVTVVYCVVITCMLLY